MKKLSPLSRTVVIIAVLVTFVVGGGGAVFLYTLYRLPTWGPTQDQPDRPEGFVHTPTPFIWPGLMQPPAVSVADAKLADDAIVIGVSQGGKHRAYSVGAMRGITKHVVNDVVGGKPTTVTYCDVKKCSRVYSGAGSEPLPVMTGGFTDRMILFVNGRFYNQDTGEAINGDNAPLPYKPMDFKETTWKAWRTAHPDTDVYVGAPAGEAPPHELAE